MIVRLDSATLEHCRAGLDLGCRCVCCVVCGTGFAISVRQLVYREAVIFLSPGSPRSGAPWVTFKFLVHTLKGFYNGTTSRPKLYNAYSVSLNSG